MPLISVIAGSKNDEALVQPTLELLQQLGIEYEFLVMSAHRNPQRVREYVSKVKERGIEVIIAAAGLAAHLPGVLASLTTVPVIGIPLPTSDLKGIDSLLSIVQMPAGVPVACVGIGSSGARNAALLAAQMLGIKHEKIRTAFEEYRRKLSET
jgi:5-(carboxyamino)imidazole ribonucleotide mutase